MDNPTFSSALASASKQIKKLGDAVVGAGRFAQKGANEIGGTAVNVADSLGIKSRIEAANVAARRAVKDGGKKFADANKAMTKAKRLAKKALDFEDEDELLVSFEYEILLSAAGATEKTIGLSSSYTQSFTVPAGSSFVWKARVKKYDVAFAVREQREKAPEPIDLETMTKYRSDTLIQGQLTASNYTRNIILVFDNTYSHLQTKRVVFWVSCGENVTLADDTVGAARALEVAAAEDGPNE